MPVHSAEVCSNQRQPVVDPALMEDSPDSGRAPRAYEGGHRTLGHDRSGVTSSYGSRRRPRVAC